MIPFLISATVLIAAVILLRQLFKIGRAHV